MIIERIHIGHFGMLQDLTCEFGPALNIVEGANEAGKSTLAAFIRYMLYGFGTHYAPGDIAEREKRVSWHSDTAEGSMEIRLQNGKRYRIERTTTAQRRDGRTSYREESRMIDLEDGSLCHGRSLPGEEFFSLPEQAYLNTAFVGHLADSRINETEMTQAMENLLFSGDERTNVLHALKSLREARTSLSHPSGVGGAIYELAGQEGAMLLRLTQAVRTNAQILATEAELHDLRSRAKEAERERDRLEEIDFTYRNYLTICSFDRLHEQETAYAEASSQLEQLRAANRHEDFLPSEEYLDSLVDAERVTEIARQNYLRSAEVLARVKETASVSAEATELMRATEQAGGEEALEEEYRQMSQRSRRGRIHGFASGIAGLCVLVAMLLLIRPPELSPASGILGLLSLLGFTFCVVFLRAERKLDRELRALCTRFGATSGADLLCKLRSVTYTKTALAEGEKSVAQAEENLAISRHNFDVRMAELSALAGRWNKRLVQGTPEEYIERISERARDYLRAESELLTQVADWRGKVEGLRAELKEESEIAIRALVSPEKRASMQHINYKRICEGLNYYRGACENLRGECEKTESKLHELERGCEDPGELRMRLTEIEERIATLRRRHAAYTLAYEAIENAGDRLRAEISPRLSGYACRLIAAVTDGRYSILDINNKLTMSYSDGETSRAIGYLSGGIRDIAYIALRLSLIDLLFREKPPVCFDESFAHQDNARLYSALRALYTVAADGVQSIIFTCQSREADIAAAVSDTTRHILLKGESAV